MASKDDLLNRMAALLAGLDDASWEALGSKGLLRRARKDLEKGLMIEVGQDDADSLSLSIKVPPYVVSMPASGPAKATCTCPAPGICQHIIVAGLHLRSQVESKHVGSSEDSIREEIRGLTAEHLKTWAGAAEYRSALTLLETNTSLPDIKYAETIIIRLMPSTIEVRFVPGGGLDGMILPSRHARRAAVAAILVLRKSLGLEIPVAVAQQALVDLSGTPRTKQEILDSACSVLEDAIAVGLTHVSSVFADRVITLAVSAQGAHLPRVALALKTVSDEVKSILRREARANEGRLLLLLSRTYALMDAIGAGGETPGLELTGAHRSHYVDVPELELSGVGAYTWQTGSGFRGLTVLFWADQTKEFLSWSDTRPDELQFDERQRFYSEGPWDGTQSPQQVASSRLKLRNARRSAAGRISSSTKTSALVLSKTAPQSIEFGDRLFSSWELLRRYVFQKQPLGLRESGPLELIGVLEPGAFGVRAFDPISQTFTWEVFDSLGQSLTMSLPFRNWTKESINILETLSPPASLSTPATSGWRFVARLGLIDDQLSVEPVSILRAEVPDSPVFNLAFDVENNSASSSEEDSQSKTEDDESYAPTGVGLGKVIGEMNRRLQAIAEAGVQNATGSHREWFAKSQTEVHDCGLTALAKVLQTLSQPSPAPALILKARFLTHLHSQATRCYF